MKSLLLCTSLAHRGIYCNSWAISQVQRFGSSPGDAREKQESLTLARCWENWGRVEKEHPAAWQQVVAVYWFLDFSAFSKCWESYAHVVQIVRHQLLPGLVISGLVFLLHRLGPVPGGVWVFERCVLVLLRTVVN